MDHSLVLCAAVQSSGCISTLTVSRFLSREYALLAATVRTVALPCACARGAVSQQERCYSASAASLLTWQARQRLHCSRAVVWLPA
eukprot:5056691-Pleurochrysis_carterae.AAC.1